MIQNSVGSDSLRNSGVLFDQNCILPPPAYKNAHNRAKEIVNKFNSTYGINDSAHQYYFLTLVGREVNRFFADQYRKNGRSNYTDLAKQQVNDYL